MFALTLVSAGRPRGALRGAVRPGALLPKEKVIVRSLHVAHVDRCQGCCDMTHGVGSAVGRTSSAHSSALAIIELDVLLRSWMISIQRSHPAGEGVPHPVGERDGPLLSATPNDSGAEREIGGFWVCRPTREGNLTLRL